MKDLLGIEIEIGDEVVFSANEYVSVTTGLVVGFGKKKILIGRKDGAVYSWQNKNINRYPTEVIVLRKVIKPMNSDMSQGV